MRGLIAISLLVVVPIAAAGQSPPPIIDMHLHALRANDQGPPPLAFCLDDPVFPPVLTGSEWPAEFMRDFKEPPCPDPVWSPVTDTELMERTLEIMERRNIIAVTNGPLRPEWQARAPGRIIPASLETFSLGPNSISLDSLRARWTDGRERVFAEVTLQYRGISPSDPAFEPYLALAEELDIPVGIHMGPGPPGAPYVVSSAYRARLHSPLLLEEALLRHPDLRVYVMHAGWPMIDDLLALMWAHPQVYVGVGIISFGIPRAEFHRYLRRIVEAGFGKRVLFGSDHMVWPEALEHAIESIETADFLSEEQKREILYDNAARFLRLSPEEMAAHGGR